MYLPAIYLASQSPRRRELLALAGVRFELLPIAIDETPLTAEDPHAYVLRMACEKARAGAQAASLLPHWRPVLAADTTVTIAGEILGKPVDRADAIAMLQRLSGAAHQVLTAMAVAESADPEQGLRTWVSQSTVWFAPLDQARIDAYVASGEPMDKAGAYAVQGAAQAFIERIEGSFSGIMGLPLAQTLALLAGQPAETIAR